MDKLILLSDEAQKLGFENLRSTFEKILDSDLELDEDLSNQIEHIKKNLDIIVSKKGRLNTKINKNFNEINCEGVDFVLDLSKKLLKKLYGNDDIEEIKEEYKILKEDVEEIKILVGKKEKTKADLAEVIREKKKYEHKIKQIELLESVIKEIENFRIKLLKILKDKEKENSEIIQVNKGEKTEIKKEEKPQKIIKVVNKKKNLDENNNGLSKEIERKLAEQKKIIDSSNKKIVKNSNEENKKNRRKSRNLKILGEEEKIKQTLNFHLLTKFKKQEQFSEFLKSYFLKNQDNEIFVGELVNIIKDFSESYIEIFAQELLKIDLNGEFYDKFKEIILDKDFDWEESKEIFLNKINF